MESEARATYQQAVAAYDYVRYTVCDMNAQSRCKLVPGRVAADFIDGGIECVDGACCLIMIPRVSRLFTFCEVQNRHS